MDLNVFRELGENAMKEFNVTGVCVPKKHYMVDISDKLRQIVGLIDRGKYFTINRARQYGKTTTFSRLEAVLKNRYTVIRFSLEGVGDDAFRTDEDFVGMFVRKAAQELSRSDIQEEALNQWLAITGVAHGQGYAFERLSIGIAELCETLDKPVILMIDEIDKSSDNQVFLNFLGMLRNKYLDAQEEKDHTFYSVILAGVYDIKNLKLKIRPDVEKKYNSPWNIAADFDVDMSFSAREIATMLESYEEDIHTGMDIQKVSEKLRFYTGGYPFLVSWLCKWMDEKGGRLFTEDNVTIAVRELLKTTNTLFDDMFKKIADYPELARMIKEMLLDGKEYPYEPTDQVISLGILFGIFTSKNNKTAISNIIFETCMYNNLLLERTRQKNEFSCDKSGFTEADGSLDMPCILRKFQELMLSEYREADGAFYEHQGGLLFLCFIKPIINGIGNYYVEPQTRGNGRMDIVVFYEHEEYIIELKIWHGEKYRQKGLAQLGEYLDARNAKRGYLVSFNFNKRKEAIAREVRLEAPYGGRDYSVYEVVI